MLCPYFNKTIAENVPGHWKPVSVKALLKWLDPTQLSLFQMIPWHALAVSTGKLDGTAPFWRMSVVQCALKNHPLSMSPQISKRGHGAMKLQA